MNRDYMTILKEIFDFNFYSCRQCSLTTLINLKSCKETSQPLVCNECLYNTLGQLTFNYRLADYDMKRKRWFNNVHL